MIPQASHYQSGTSNQNAHADTAKLLGAVLNSGVLGGVGWSVYQQGRHLHLADRVERDNPDVCVGERLGGVVDLCQDLAGVVAAKHGQLVHSPVPTSNETRYEMRRTQHVVECAATFDLYLLSM